jgi:NAD(P)-dependent dehydrogenase (short-subunit alcohol dehydrogenase family)
VNPRIILITGTSTGIGRATAEVLARAGHTVIATLRRPEDYPDLAALAATEGLRFDVTALDVEDDASVRTAVARTLAEHGAIDVLVNNAGIGGSGPVEEAPIDLFRRVYETNVLGAVRCTQAVLPSMRARRSGAIVNVTSIAGRIALAAHGPYAASKFALEAVSEALAQEVAGFGIRVAIVEPGVIATPIFRKTRTPLPVSPYSHHRRLRALLAASYRAFQAPPEIVAARIRTYIESNSRTLRLPVGPDADMLLGWRAGLSDEEWVALSALDDETWCQRVRESTGLDVAAELQRQ